MAISFNKAMGIHEHALMLRESRAQLLANNLANADTPNYKARDIDFQRQLSLAASGHALAGQLRRSHQRHLPGASGAGQSELQYRVPMQPSIDGNTVDEQLEMAQFARNALEFQASLIFVQRALAGLKTAIGNQ